MGCWIMDNLPLIVSVLGVGAITIFILYKMLDAMTTEV